jgi:putative tricarboxylic transport membrane protein
MKKDVVSGCVLVLVALAYYGASTAIQSSTLEDEFGPGGLPFILATLLGLVGAVIALRGLALAPPAAAFGSGELRRFARGLGVLAIGFAYILLVPYLGFILTIALLIVAVALYEGLPLSWRVPAVAGAGAGFLWLLFVKLLGVPQPAGLLF